MPMPSAGAYDWLDDALDEGGELPTLRGEPPAVPPGAPPINPAAIAGQGDTPQFVNPGTGDPEVGMFIRATDVQWAKLVELGVTSMRKLIDYLAATDASARCNGAPAGVPVVLKRSLFNWCRDSGRQVHLEIEAAVACGYLIQGGVAPYEWLHCCPPGGVQAPPATQIAATAAGESGKIGPGGRPKAGEDGNWFCSGLGLNPGCNRLNWGVHTECYHCKGPKAGDCRVIAGRARQWSCPGLQLHH